MENQDLYNRQQKLNLKPVKSAIVVGCGGTGSWTALFLAMSGCPTITLMDSDILEVTNFNRLPLAQAAYVGKEKARAVADLIQNLRPDCVVMVEGKATKMSLDTLEGDFLFDCTDRQATQKMLFDYCASKKNPAIKNYIRCGYNGTHFTVTDHVSTWATDDVADEGYTIDPSWVCPAALPATIAVAKAYYDASLDISMDIKDLGKKR